jgi:hypothetical protein
MSVNLYQTTRRNIPKDSHLHTRRRENLKSHSGQFVYKLATVVIGTAGVNTVYVARRDARRDARNSKRWSIYE